MSTVNTVFQIDGGWLHPAKACPSPNHNDRPIDEISLLVIHNISLPPGCFDTPYIEAFFQNRLDSSADAYFEQICDLKVSAHLLIKRSGEVCQFVPFHKRAWHAGVSSYQGRQNCNDFSIGIELEGTDEVAYTGQQYRVLVDVCRCLFKHYPGLKPEHTVGHCDVAPERKTDPGSSFDWAYFRAELSALTDADSEI